MLQLLRKFYDWFCEVFGFFWLASLVAIPYLSYRAKQNDFNMLDTTIMYVAVFIGAFGLLKEDLHGRPQQGPGPQGGRVE